MSNQNVVEQVKTEQSIEATQRINVLPTSFSGTFKGTTPSVKNVEFFQAKNTSPTNVTNVLDGQETQQIHILGDGNATMKHGTKIFNNTGADKLLAVNKVYRYTKFNGLWYEDA